MTQTDVAQAIGKGLHHISEMEAGRKETSLDIIAAYARAVDLPWIEIP
jgi:DNA-binding XRE family transcriptional regulator